MNHHHLQPCICMHISMDGSQDHSSSYINELQAERDDQDPSTQNNVSGNGSSSHDHAHLQTNCNNGGFHEARHNHHFPANQIILNPQAGGPVGLKLRKSPSILKKLLLLTKEKQRERHQQPAFDQIAPKKSKATNIPAVFLKIGSWEWVSRNAGDLVAKFYYGRKKLVWEFLYGCLKKKIEIPWSHLSAINVFVGEDKKGVLEIELNEQPLFGQETSFQAGKHTIWESSDDFTQRQASVCRRHSVVFLPGVLDEAFKKLLQCDSRLFDISRQPFPTNNSLFFRNQVLDFSNNRSIIVHGSSAVSNYGHQGTFQPRVQNLDQPTTSFAHHSNSNLPLPGLVFSNPNEVSMGVPFENQTTNGVGNRYIQDGDQQDHIPNHGEESWFLDQELKVHLTDIQNLAEFTNNLSWIPGLQQEVHLTDIHNPSEDQFTNTQNCFEVESTCKPFKENHRSDFNTCGNVDDLDGTQVNNEVDVKEHNSWEPKDTGIDDSSNMINDMAYLDDNLWSIVHESGLNNRFAFMEDFNTDENGMKKETTQI